MKKLSVILVLVMLITAVLPAQAGILPKSQELIEKVLPSISYVLKRMPDEETSMEDGSLRATYRNVTAENYDAFSEYLDTCGCVLVDYTVSDGIACFILEKDGTPFIFEYDTGSMTAILTYPAGYGEERNWAREVNEEANGQTVNKIAGSYVTFGTYPQTAAGVDETPIEWLVLDYDAANNRALLISRYGLDVQPYNSSRTNVTWEACTLRAWLNDTFVKRAFSEPEQAMILLTNVDNSRDQGCGEWSTDGGTNTWDRVFLLSYSEANRFFDIQNCGSDTNESTKSSVTPTAYAISRGAYTSMNIKLADGTAAGWWWLRSPGNGQNFAANVISNGSLGSTGVNYANVSVRPALWVNLSALDITVDNGISVDYSVANVPVVDEIMENAVDLTPYKTVGSYVTYGTYPQTKAGNDSTPIEWLVLEYDAKNNRTLLISRYGLDCRQYNTANTSVTWETCTLRAWLNSAFLNKAFSPAEQGAILTVTVDNSNVQCYRGWNTNGGNSTQDKIFLLSYAEANKYLGATPENCINTKSRVAPTAYAIARGTFVYSHSKTADGLASGYWWLRSPGDKQSSAARVGCYGELSPSTVIYPNPLIRPAFWLDLSGI